MGTEGVKKLIEVVSSVIGLAAKTSYVREVSGPPKPLLPGTSHIATPPGVSQESYCLDCISKHLATAKILLREALQRSQAKEAEEAVLAKVRGAFEELTGAEDDSQSLTDPQIRNLNARIREARKWLYEHALASASPETISKAFSLVEELLGMTYREIESRKKRVMEALGRLEETIKEAKAKVSGGVEKAYEGGPAIPGPAHEERSPVAGPTVRSSGTQA